MISASRHHPRDRSRRRHPLQLLVARQFSATPACRPFADHVLSAAINNLTKGPALEVASDGILVNAIGIGAVATENWANNMIPAARNAHPELVRSIAQGRAWIREILAGSTTHGIAARENKSERTIRLMLSLAFLDPKLVKAALLGNLPRGVSTRRLLDAPANWHDQWRSIGLSRPV